MIALDLDDTLLRGDLSISDYTRATLRNCCDRGIYVVLASGRSFKAMKPTIDSLGINKSEYGRYIICQNGSVVVDTHTGKEIMSTPIPVDCVRDGVQFALENGVPFEIYRNEVIYIPFTNEYSLLEAKLTGLPYVVTDQITSMIDGTDTKFVIPAEPAKVSELYPKLVELCGDRASVFTSKPFFLEMLSKDSGKGQAILWLSSRLGIDQKNTMAFGDSMNDETMLRMVNHSVLMKNGLDVLRSVAKYVTDYTNEEDGVARFIDVYFLNGTTIDLSTSPREP